jgi:hypothetical protein
VIAIAERWMNAMGSVSTSIPPPVTSLPFLRLVPSTSYCATERSRPNSYSTVLPTTIGFGFCRSGRVKPAELGGADQGRSTAQDVACHETSTSVSKFSLAVESSPVISSPTGLNRNK